MPRVRWSATLEQDEGSATTQTQKVRKSNLKPPSMGAPRRKSKAAVRMERERRRGAKDAEAWRERGKLFRAKIMMKDEESGGDVFTLSNQCEIEKYYDVAERVLEQFLNTTVEDKAKLTEAYLVGNRLVKFVSRVLPTHKDYFSNDPKRKELRCQSQSQLVQLLQYLEELALIIDEEEYQEFIRENQELMTLSGEEADDDSSSDGVSSLEHDIADRGLAAGSKQATGLTATKSAQRGVNKFQHLQQAAFDKAKTQDTAAADAGQHSSQTSRIRKLQNQESKSWDQAFSDKIAPSIPGFEPPKIEVLFPETATSGLEWSFPTDFDSSGAAAAPEHVDTTVSSPSFTADFSSTVDFTSDSNAWPSEEQSSKVETHSSFSVSPEKKPLQQSRHNKPPEKMTLRPKAIFGAQGIDREQSPKSVFELPEFMPEKLADDEDSNTPPTVITSGSVEGYLQRIDVERPPPSDDGLSALSGEEEEASLTGAPMQRRTRMGHFKGCVRCLLE